MLEKEAENMESVKLYLDELTSNISEETAGMRWEAKWLLKLYASGFEERVHNSGKASLEKKYREALVTYANQMNEKMTQNVLTDIFSQINYLKHNDKLDAQILAFKIAPHTLIQYLANKKNRLEKHFKCLKKLKDNKYENEAEELKDTEVCLAYWKTEFLKV